MPLLPFEIIGTVIAAFVSLLAGAITSSDLVRILIRRLFNLPDEKPASYAERLSSLTKKLDTASDEVDEVLREIAEVTQDRQQTVLRLEGELQSLETKERELKGRIEALQNTPVEVAKHFAELVSAGEKKSARGDYLLFGAGVLVTTIIGLVIQFVGG